MNCTYVQYVTYLYQIDIVHDVIIRIIRTAADDSSFIGAVTVTTAERIIASRYDYPEHWSVEADALCAECVTHPGDILVFEFSDGSAIVWRGADIDCI